MNTFSEISFADEDIRYIVPSWIQMEQVNFDVIKQVNQSGKKYDRIVALAKGGWTWARAFADGVGMDNLSSLRLKLYKGIEQKTQEPQIVEPLGSAVKGCRVLLFDDVVDSGETYAFAKEHLIQVCGASEVDTAALFWKPHATIKPDFYCGETSAWIVFPHEIREFITETAVQWREKGLSKGEILSRYFQLGLPFDQSEYYLQVLNIL